jgi:AraC-like DNA-binding protein
MAILCPKLTFNIMGWKNTYESKIDPSGIKQKFVPINLKVHCCRYWKLNEWEYQNMSFPFWRLYYNTIEGARVSYKNETVHLNPDIVLLIPPHTSFSTSLRHKISEGLSGNRIESVEELSNLRNIGMVDHFFVHFNLSFQFDNVSSGLYSFEADQNVQEILNHLRFSLIEDGKFFNQSNSLLLYHLILKLVCQIDKKQWNKRHTDARVLKIIDYIDNNYHKEMSNEFLAQKVNLAPNSFLRLFKQSMGITIQRYIQQTRINKAILELSSSDVTIDQVAQRCGFSERYHFSKVFKRVAGISPARYRQLKTY